MTATAALPERKHANRATSGTGVRAFNRLAATCLTLFALIWLVILTVVVCSMIGFGSAHLHFRGKSVTFALILAGFMLPTESRSRVLPISWNSGLSTCSGCWRVYYQFCMPLCRPVISAVAILTFITSWNAFL